MKTFGSDLSLDGSNGFILNGIDGGDRFHGWSVSSPMSMARLNDLIIGARYG